MEGWFFLLPFLFVNRRTSLFLFPMRFSLNPDPRRFSSLSIDPPAKEKHLAGRPIVLALGLLLGWSVGLASLAEGGGWEDTSLPESRAGGNDAIERPSTEALPATESVESLRKRFGLTEPSTASDSQNSLEEEEAYFELLKEFVDTLDKIEHSYVHEVSRKKLIGAAIRGMLGELDPYSTFIEPEHASTFQEELDHRFGGIGVRLARQDGKLTVITPLPNSPALEAGIRSGDLVLKIDGTSTRRMSLDEAVRRLQGVPGTEVSLTLSHADKDSTQRTVTLNRRIIAIESIVGYRRLPGGAWDFRCMPEEGIAYVRIVSFGPETARRLREVLERLTEESAEGLVLDLRFNPGGLFASGVEVADLFLEEGVIVKTRGRRAAEKIYRADGEGTYSEIPLAVLINRYSASASELLAAALQDHDRALILGERSWGKGCVQKVVSIGEGSGALKLTTAQYLRPSGEDLHRFPEDTEKDVWGVIPHADYRLRLTVSETRKLEALFNQRDIIPEGASTEKLADQQEGDPSFTDPHLLMALEYFRARKNEAP